MTKVAIIGKSTTEDSFGIHSHYVNYFGHLGMTAILPPMTKTDFREVTDFFDVVVIPGGADISPVTYGAMPGVTTGKADPALEYFDAYNLATALDHCLVVGICRGFQALMVNAGYTLTQEIGGFHPRSNGWYEMAHKVSVYSHNKPFKYETNSLHHQGVVIQPSECDAWLSTPDASVKLLAADLSATNRVVVEAAEGTGWLGIQWHPEATDDPLVLNWIRQRLNGSMIRS
jgi:putative glutamine amidotransferase